MYYIVQRDQTGQVRVYEGDLEMATVNEWCQTEGYSLLGVAGGDFLPTLAVHPVPDRATAQDGKDAAVVDTFYALLEQRPVQAVNDGLASEPSGVAASIVSTVLHLDMLDTPCESFSITDWFAAVVEQGYVPLLVHDTTYRSVPAEDQFEWTSIITDSATQSPREPRSLEEPDRLPPR